MRAQQRHIRQEYQALGSLRACHASRARRFRAVGAGAVGMLFVSSAAALPPLPAHDATPLARKASAPPQPTQPPKPQAKQAAKPTPPPAHPQHPHARVKPVKPTLPRAARPALAAPAQETPAANVPGAAAPSDSEADHHPDEAQADDDAQAIIPGSPQDPASRYGRMTAAMCMHEARARGLSLSSAGASLGVLAPVRLTGAIGGVRFHSALPESQRSSSVYEVFDCRLVLALHDWAKVLRQHDVVEVVHMSAYRPPSAKTWPANQLGTRHTGALAIDAGTFIKGDGTKLVVDKDYHGYIGQRPCGDKSTPWPPAPEATALRKLTCDTIDAKLFHVVLTPGFNQAHHNHFHLEVSAKGTHFYVR
jgi:hypothetical protein